MNPNPKNDKEFERLRQLIERIGFGEVRVIIQQGKPVRVDHAIKQIKLDSPDDFAQGLDAVRLS